MIKALVPLKSVPKLVNRAKAHLYGMMEALGIEGRKDAARPSNGGQPPFFISREELERIKRSRKK